MERCRFGSGHGKSECDAVGGVIKRLLEDDTIIRSVIQNVHMFQYCVNHHMLPEVGSLDGCCHKKWSFCLIHPDAVDRTLLSSSLKTIPGTHLLHSIKPVGVATRRLFSSVLISLRNVSTPFRGPLYKLQGQEAFYIIWTTT